MGLLDIFRRSNLKTADAVEERSYLDGMGMALNYGTYYSNFKTSKSMMLSTVYRCVTCISNGVASLPAKLYAIDSKGYKMPLHNELSYCISKQPNSKMTAYTFFSLIVKDILLAGNGYALIRKNGDKVVGLDYIQPGYVSPIDKGDHIEYMVAGIKGTVRAEDILHFLNYSEDGIIGISTLAHARRTLGISDFSDGAAEGFFKSGACASGFLKFTSPSNGKQREEILSAWQQASGGTVGTPAGIAVLPSNVEFTQLSISPADAQLLESRKFNVEDICRFFSISPVKAFDLTKSSYATVEATELSFLNDTLRPILVKLEEEMERKFFPGQENYDIRFDVTELLRADKASQAEYFSKLFTVGAITSNEIRKALDMEPVEGGDEALVQVNLCKLKNIGNYNNAEQDNRLKNTNENDNE